MPTRISKPGKARDPDQYMRFLEAAKKAEASDDPKAFDKAFGRVAKSRLPSTTKADVEKKR